MISLRKRSETIGMHYAPYVCFVLRDAYREFEEFLSDMLPTTRRRNRDHY